jgi:hypothetical protein
MKSFVRFIHVKFTVINKFFFVNFLWTILFISASPGSVFAQEKTIQYSDQQWFQYDANVHLSKKLSALFCTGYRVKELMREPVLYKTVGGLSYSLSKNLKTAAGIYYVGDYTSFHISKTEVRIFQELSLKNEFKKLFLNNRVKVEQRWFHYIEGGNTFNFRFRYRFMLGIPVKKWNNSSWSVQIGDEVFFNAGKNIVYNTFDQNRVLIGTTFKLNSVLAFYLVYNRQFRSSSSISGHYYREDVLWLGIKQNFLLHKKRK